MPLWRLEVLADNQIVFALHHAIGDGLSSAVFHRSLVRALQANPATASSSVAVPDLPLLPPIEHVTDIRPSVSTIFKILVPTLIPKAWTGHPVPKLIPIQTHVRLLSFETVDVKRFSDICRSHKASITSTIYEFAVCIISRLLASELGQYKTISINTPISLRPLVGPQYDDAMCNYVSSHATFPPVHAEFSWKLAARVAADLQIQKQKCREKLGLISLQLIVPPTP
ncbi:hypothetical protein B0H17DRAFT_391147 [Mycena rosella]|uniref:Alcohol acetyltransferase n=1 Tax=Mycena rosella TaxID=1033263 RepID=A0AAD7DSL8_MYCRO|nr:hypothetical protein B0H17DRAFT_391147 [Mycena rosella]